MTSNVTISVLDNPVWHALNTQHEQFAIGTHLAKRYLPEVAAYCAVIDYRDEAIHDLLRLAANDHDLRFLERELPPELPGWTLSRTFPIDQMVCEQSVGVPKSDVQIVELSAADVPAMISLIKQARIAPFLPRTIEMGRYLGIRHEGQLIAIAGERLYLTGYREISAICTAPGHQGKGYARLLTGRLVNENWQRGDVPFLHVVATNIAAVHLYESLNFRKRAEMHVSMFTRSVS